MPHKNDHQQQFYLDVQPKEAKVNNIASTCKKNFEKKNIRNKTNTSIRNLTQLTPLLITSSTAASALATNCSTYLFNTTASQTVQQVKQKLFDSCK